MNQHILVHMDLRSIVIHFQIINNLRKLLIEFVYFKQNIVIAAANNMPRVETITRTGT